MKLQINGRSCDVAVRDASLLVEVLRDDLGLTGTHVGCDTAQCGACTVVMDGRAVKACNVLARQVEGAAIQTVEGLAPHGGWHALQLAFSRHHALQCGYCTPGMLMRAVAREGERGPAEPAAVGRALVANLCRCTGYEGIVAAICDWLGGQPGGAPDAGL